MGTVIEMRPASGDGWAEAHALQARLATTEAKLAGALAMVQAYRDEHPDSPLHATDAATGKTRIAGVFQAAFDRVAKRLGIAA